MKKLKFDRDEVTWRAVGEATMFCALTFIITLGLELFQKEVHKEITYETECVVIGKNECNNFYTITVNTTDKNNKLITTEISEDEYNKCRIGEKRTVETEDTIMKMVYFLTICAELITFLAACISCLLVVIMLSFGLKLE